MKDQIVLADNRQVNSDFRHVLRASTRAEHDETESVFATFMADPAARMDWFLCAQRSAIWALSRAVPAHQRLLSATLLDDLIQRLDFDLEVRGLRYEPVDPDRHLHPVAVDYILLGSRLGTEVIRRRIWPDPADLTVPTYFLSRVAQDCWKRHCGVLESIDPDSRIAQNVVDDAKEGFALFYRAAIAQTQTA